MSATARPATGGAARQTLFEEETLGKAYDLRLLRRLMPFVMPYRRQVAATILFVFPLLVFELLPAWIVKTGLDHVIVPAAGGATPAAEQPIVGFLRAPDGLPPLLWLALVYFAMSAAAAADIAK